MLCVLPVLAHSVLSCAQGLRINKIKSIASSRTFLYETGTWFSYKGLLVKSTNDRKHLVPHSDFYVLVKNKMTWRSLLDTDGFIHHCFCTLNAHANTVLKENDISVMKKIVLTFEVLESAFAKSPGVHLDSRGSGSHILGTAVLEAKYGFHSN